MSASPHQNLLHLLCSCSSELYHHPLGHLSWRAQGHSTLPHALLHQPSPLPVGHSPCPVSCLLSQTLYSDILMTGLSATRFPLVQCSFHITARDTAQKNRCDIPYRAKPKLLTLALPLRHSPAKPQTTLEPYLLPLLHRISPLCEHWALSQLHGSTEKEMDTIQKGIQNTQVDGTIQSPLHSLFCLRCSVPSLPGTGYRICDAIPNFPTVRSVLHLRSCQFFVRDSVTAFTPLCSKLFFIYVSPSPQGPWCPLFLSLPSV